MKRETIRSKARVITPRLQERINLQDLTHLLIRLLLHRISSVSETTDDVVAIAYVIPVGTLLSSAEDLAPSWCLMSSIFCGKAIV